MTVHPVTESVRERFPLAYQDADDRIGQPLLRWLSLLGDQAGEVSDLADRIDGAGGLSALVDPDSADDGWLRWLGQLPGFRFAATMPPSAMRAAMRTATFQRGTAATMTAVAKRYLKPGATVRITVTEPWAVTVSIYPRQVIGLTYGELKVAYPTYTALKAAFTTYADYTSQTGNLLAALQAEKPAGAALTVTFTGATYADMRAGWATYADVKTAFSTYTTSKAYSP